MRRFWPLLAIALAGALGWWIAPPASVSQMGGELGLGDLGTVAAGEASADIASQLETIYTRKVWSSRNPTEQQKRRLKAKAAAKPLQNRQRWKGWTVSASWVLFV